MVTNAPAAEAWSGDGWAKGKKYQNQRAILPLYTTYFQMYSLADTKIKSIKDFDGKSVGVGPIGGTPATYWPKIIEMAGVKPKRIVNASSADLNSQLKDGMLDANGNSLGVPWVTITEIETTHDANVYGVPDDVCNKFVEKFPYFAKGFVPKGTYKSNKDKDIETLTLWNFMVVNKNMPDDFVYEVVKNTFANVDILIAAHSSAAEVKLENVIYSPVPLHPGAIKFYEEKGIKIPEKLLPPK
jgi:TRAP transporter TAXI family solute receptor